jgi:multimeric flavodoxin WrbA
MKIIALVGSPHGEKGATARLTHHVISGLESLDAETETIYLKGQSVLPCLGCDICHKKGDCVQKDEFETIKNKIHDADGVILASPNYIFHVSAQLKALIDRLNGVVHCLGFEGKYGASVVTSGGGDEPPIAEYMNHFMTITGIVPVGSVWATMALIEGDEFPGDLQEKAFNLGVDLAESIREKRRYSQAEVKIEVFKQRMKDLMLWKKDEWPFEYQYWRKYRGI